MHGGHSAEKVIWECLKAHPREITIVALGPLTNISRVLKRDPSIAELIGDLVICGGTVHASGNATPTAASRAFSARAPKCGASSKSCPLSPKATSRS
mgnify:CR=1 FL=1